MPASIRSSRSSGVAAAPRSTSVHASSSRGVTWMSRSKPQARTSCRHRPNEGSTSPDSILATRGWDTPARAASARWDNPARRRASRTNCPASIGPRYRRCIIPTNKSHQNDVYDASRAGGVGFEPTDELPHQRFSRPSPSSARPSSQVAAYRQIKLGRGDLPLAAAADVTKILALARAVHDRQMETLGAYFVRLNANRLEGIAVLELPDEGEPRDLVGTPRRSGTPFAR